MSSPAFQDTKIIRRFHFFIGLVVVSSLYAVGVWMVRFLLL